MSNGKSAGKKPARRIPTGVWVVALLAVVLIWLLLGRASEESPAASQVAPETQTIENKGSDTLVNLALAWAEAYMPSHPGVSISVTGGGSGTGIAAMINGTVDIANASRVMKPEEIAAARANGTSPVEFVVARDAIAVAGNRDVGGQVAVGVAVDGDVGGNRQLAQCR